MLSVLCIVQCVKVFKWWVMTVIGVFTSLLSAYTGACDCTKLRQTALGMELGANRVWTGAHSHLSVVSNRIALCCGFCLYLYGMSVAVRPSQ